MLSCLRDTYFSKLDYVGRKEVVLKEIETNIKSLIITITKNLKYKSNLKM